MVKGELARIDKELLQKVLQGSFGGLSSADPIILSCGGIYIPHKNETQKVFYHILTTSNDEMPVKIVSAIKPRNLLHQVLRKESLN